MIETVLQWVGVALMFAAMSGALRAEGRPVDLSSARCQAAPATPR